MHNTETLTEIKCKPNTLFFFFLVCNLFYLQGFKLNCIALHTDSLKHKAY